MTQTEQTDQIEPLAGQRQKSETDNAVIACNDWLRMGSGRSIPKLIAMYLDKSHFVNGFKPPSVSHATLATWSSRYDWPARGAAFDAEWEQRKTVERNAELAYGAALDFDRVRRLKRLADFLEGQIYERGESGVFHNVWVPDVKQIGSGEYAERVDIERFNSALISEYRSTLDDIAKEVGGRVTRQEVTGADGGALEIVIRHADG